MNKKIDMKFFYILTAFLIVIEQGIKLVVNSQYLESNTTIWKGFLYFNPMFNRDYSWFNSMLKLGISKWFHIGFVGIVLAIIVLFYFYLNKDEKTDRFVDTIFAFIISGAFCSLVDKVFWNGSLDYIYVKGYFTFDLKDVYINVFIGLFLLAIVINHKKLREVDENVVTKDFFLYLKALIKK